MSEPDEDVTVEERGVSVRKSLNDDQFETLAVVFDVRSGRDEASTVTLVDTVPDDVPVDDIGFHPEYGGEHWHADGGEVVFSRTFEPGEQYTTVYGIRDFDGDRAGLLAEPAVEIGVPEVGAADADEAVGAGPVRDVDAIDALVSEEDSQVVREVISGERDTLPGLEGSAGAGASADAGVPAGGEPSGADGAPAGPADGDAPADAEAAAGPGDADDEVAEVDLPEPGQTEADADGPAGGAFGDDGEDVAVEDALEADLDGDVGLDDEITDLGTEEPAEAAPGTVLGADEAEGEAEDDEPEVDEGIASPATDEPAGEAAEADGEAAMDDEETEEPPTVESEVDEAAADEALDEEAPEETAAEGADEPETGVGAVMQDVGAAGTPPEDEEAVAAEAGTTDEPSGAEDEPGETTEARADDGEITVPVTGGIARVLAKELRAGNVSYEDRRLLREELLPDDGSTDARIQHLQNQVADLEAYTDALEQFLDEEGGAQAALSRVEERVDSIANDVEAVEESLGGIDEEVGSLRDGVADVAEEVEDVADDVDEVEDDVEAMEAEVSAVSGDVDRVADDVDRLEDDMTSVRDDVGRIDGVDRRLESVEDDVSAIQDELEELATFRDRLSSVFGPGGMGGGGQGESED